VIDNGNDETDIATYHRGRGVTDGDWRIEVENIQRGGHWDFLTINEIERFPIDFLEKIWKNI
jgi:hypothetical protein